MKKRLPDSEFEIMNIIWDLNKPVTSSDIIDKLSSKDCKAPTIISYLKRLENKKVITSEKCGKERYYKALIKKEEYLNFETTLFFKKYHNNSVLSLMNALAQSKAISHEEIEALKKELDKFEKE